MDLAYTTEDKTRRWEYHREIKNLMGKYMYSQLLCREHEIYERFWSKRQDVCLGLNAGWYSGREAVQQYLNAIYRTNLKIGLFMQKIFPEKLAGKTAEELLGAGPYNSKPISSAVIEIAEDEKTAKGLWYSRGSEVKITPSGPVSYWTWGCYAVDFVYEENAWKIWHLQYLLDIHTPCGQSWGRVIFDYPKIEGFEDADNLYAEIPAPNVPKPLREQYHPNRPFTKLPDYPEPYATFAATFSYGMEGEHARYA